jgi:glycosyltransferase involved in cell wall biosynthesis
MTSAWEGFPLAVLEAMRSGLPAVAYDVGGIREQVEHGATGLLPPLGDRDGVVAALLSLSVDERRRVAMGEAAAERFQRRFTVSRMVDELEEVYETAAARARSATHS